MAFSLLELLVVIAIIAILAALLLPALARARMATDNTVCQHNLQQISLAVNSYTADASGYFPFNVSSTVGMATNIQSAPTWPDKLEPYAHSQWPQDGVTNFQVSPTVVFDADRRGRSIYVCPGYNRLPGLYKNNFTGWPGPLCGAYAFNGYGVRSMGPLILGLAGQAQPVKWQTFQRPVKETEVAAPSEMIANYDANLLVPYWNSHYRFGISGTYFDGQLANASPMRHNGRWNTLFCDGHLEHLKSAQLFSVLQPYGPPVLDAAVACRWNLDHQPHLDLSNWPGP